MLTTIGDMAQVFLTKRQTAQTKTEMNRLLAEVSSGLVADPAARLGGDFSGLVSIDATLSRLSGFDAVTRDLSTILSVRQAAVSKIDTLSGDAASRLLGASQGPAQGLDSAARATRAEFETVISALNQRYADRSVFSGTSTDGPALLGADVIVAAAAAAVTGATTPAEVEQRLDQWLADPAGFAAAAYRGGAPVPSVLIAKGETVSLDVTALDPGLRQTMKGFLLGTFAAPETLGADLGSRSDLARRAGEALAAAAPDRADMAARIGLAQARVESAQTRNTAEASALRIARSALLASDPAEAAIGLREAEARLDALFTLTARLARLTLAERL